LFLENLSTAISLVNQMLLC